MADLQDGFWDNLLDYIQDRTVIPVIGSELVTVREGDREVPVDRWIAQRLAGDLKLSPEELPEGFALNDVVSMHLRRGEGRQREELYAQIHRLLRNAALTPSESLRTLAGIPGLDLFISLTFDSLLAEALGGAQQISYSPNTVRDLSCPKAELRQPVVFHLLGRSSASPDYAICDDDLLEFLHAMQDRQRQPKTLFDELRGNQLLILGCSFGDWLTRFFLRTARSLGCRRSAALGRAGRRPDRTRRQLRCSSKASVPTPGSSRGRGAVRRGVSARWHGAHRPRRRRGAGRLEAAAADGASRTGPSSSATPAMTSKRPAGGRGRARRAGSVVRQDALRWEMLAPAIRRGLERCSCFCRSSRGPL